MATPPELFIGAEQRAKHRDSLSMPSPKLPFVELKGT